jgi:hypothetical protein
VFLYGTLAVAVLGAGGPPADPGATVSYTVGDRLGNNAVIYLWLLPITTAALGWAGAAATAGVRARLVTAGGAGPVQAVAGAGLLGRRTAFVVLLSAAVAASLFLVALMFLRG